MAEVDNGRDNTEELGDSVMELDDDNRPHRGGTFGDGESRIKLSHSIPISPSWRSLSCCLWGGKPRLEHRACCTPAGSFFCTSMASSDRDLFPSDEPQKLCRGISPDEMRISSSSDSDESEGGGCGNIRLCLANLLRPLFSASLAFW